MSDVADRIDHEVATSDLSAVSGNEAVFGRIRAERTVSIGFVPGYVAHVATADLEGRIAEVVTSLLTQVEEAQRVRASRTSGRTTREAHVLDLSREVFLDRVDHVTARGEATGGTVVVTRIGHQSVTVDLSLDAVARLGEDGLGDAVAEATEAMADDRRHQVLRARRDVYYPEISWEEE